MTPLSSHRRARRYAQSQDHPHSNEFKEVVTWFNDNLEALVAHFGSKEEVNAWWQAVWADHHTMAHVALYLKTVTINDLKKVTP